MSTTNEVGLRRLGELSIKPATLDDKNLLQFLIISGPYILPHISEDSQGYLQGEVELAHPGTGHNAGKYIVLFKP